MVAKGQCKWAGGGGWCRGLDGSDSYFQATPDKLARKKSLSGELPPDSSPTPRLSGCTKSRHRLRDPPLHSLFSPREPSPAPSGRPVTSTHAAQGADFGHTLFNRRHQQPPGKLRKVDTLIPVPVSGEQA